MSDKIAVEKMDAKKKNSPISGPVTDESTVLLDNVPNACVWNDQEFSEGQLVECEGEVYECNSGHWVKRS